MRLGVTDHAADRYADRVKPHLDRTEARAEIERLAAGVEPVPLIDFVEPGEHFDYFIELAPGIALGCRWNGSTGLTAVTTMIRTGKNPEELERRRTEKKRRKNKARAQKRREQIARRNGNAKPDGYLD